MEATISHTTTLSTIDIKNESAIRNAVAYLREQLGIKVSIVENQVPRLYGQSQMNEVGKCDLVLKLDGSPYDVGLKKNKNGNFVPIFDSWNGHVARLLGSKESDKTGNLYGAEKDIGLFLSAYTVHAAKASLEDEHGDQITCTISYDKAADEFRAQAEFNEGNYY